MKPKVTRLVTVFVVLLALIGAACGNDDNGGDDAGDGGGEGGASGDPIKIGVIAPLSGDFASLGEDAVDGVELAVSQINTAGGVLGRPLEAIVEDGAADPTVTLNAITKLTTRDNVSALFGTLCSGCTISVLDAIEDAAVPHFTIGDGSLEIATQGSQWTHLISDNENVRAAAIIDAIDNFFEVDNVGILVSEASEPGQAIREMIEANYEGTDVSVTSVVAATGAADYRPELTRLRDAGAELIVNGGSAGDEQALILRQMQDLGMGDTPTIGLLWVDDILEGSSEAAVENFFFTTSYLPSLEGSAAQEFTAAYEAEFGQDPSKYSAISDSGVKIFAAAVEAAGTDDPEAVLAEIPNVTIETELGTPTFDETGSWAIRTHVAKYEAGDLVVVHEQE